jgi:hypothetical protein
MSLDVISSTQLDVRFDEALDETQAEITNHYTIVGIENPITADLDTVDNRLVHLTFLYPFPNGELLTLSVFEVEDLENNAMDPAQTLDFSYYEPNRYDVVINEIFADEIPPIPTPNPLPAHEFIELHNRTNIPISLKNWTYSDESTTSEDFPNVSIPADSFMILCKEEAILDFSAYGIVLGLNSWPGLNNDGDDLTIRDQTGKIIHNVVYDVEWYEDAQKKEGGWSLEMVDPQNPCAGIENWKEAADISGGGTPGATNSVLDANPDLTLPELIRALPIGLDTVALFFSETVDSAIAGNRFMYEITPDIGTPSSVTVLPASFNSVKLALSTDLGPNTIYTATVTNVTDCAGNSMGVDSVMFGIPELADSFDIIINEILFNPVTGGVDFVEIYNRSEKIIDIKNFIIGEVDPLYPDVLLDFDVLAPEGFLLFPESYLVLTENEIDIKQNYYAENPEAFMRQDAMPGYPDDEGIVVLRDHFSQELDRLHYTDDWHFSLLDDENGVSLERIDFDQTTQNQNNWHSAASGVGFATPTYQNSSYGNFEVPNAGEITIEPDVFSPDQDGYNDILQIGYQLNSPGHVGNLTIFDARGRVSRNLVQNELLALEGFFTWDGTGDDGQKAQIGIYIIYFEIFDLEGNVEKHKERVVLGGRL